VEKVSDPLRYIATGGVDGEIPNADIGTMLAKYETSLISQNGARPRRRYARRRTMIYIVSYAGVSSSSEARMVDI
jgi:hypothetical protein